MMEPVSDPLISSHAAKNHPVDDSQQLVLLSHGALLKTAPICLPTLTGRMDTNQ